MNNPKNINNQVNNIPSIQYKNENLQISTNINKGEMNINESQQNINKNIMNTNVEQPNINTGAHNTVRINNNPISKSYKNKY